MVVKPLWHHGAQKSCRPSGVEGVSVNLGRAAVPFDGRRSEGWIWGYLVS